MPHDFKMIALITAIVMIIYMAYGWFRSRNRSGGPQMVGIDYKAPPDFLHTAESRCQFQEEIEKLHHNGVTMVFLNLSDALPCEDSDAYATLAGLIFSAERDGGWNIVCLEPTESLLTAEAFDPVRETGMVFKTFEDACTELDARAGPPSGPIA